MLNFILCDDNKSIMQRLASMLNSIFIKHNFSAQISLQADNVYEVLDFVCSF